ncbi:histidinol-phosphate aminotransferase [Pilimelia terevasa]|uniref:Histidinol-phosphate aminotransferase n=1 Tax=Pilimelia terevasa TaxID=53372 RepID=A0A8J3BLG8_9ACTN|nr:histidinol-phosphate transaminase [Pilimelia terevasa]GGK22891.1 histidinol-phosphate aminotransferase [Pilimelia terevasa]
MTGLADLPLREELRGRSPYGAPQRDVAVRLNTNENAHPVPAEVVDAVAEAVRAELAGLNRYPDRDAVALRAALADYLGHGLGVDQVWAANGSNEVQQQLLQAFAGPGRAALGFGPAYSMHPLLALGTGTRWIGATRGADFDLTPAHAAAQVAAHRPDVVLVCAPNNPTGTALAPATLAAILDAAPGIVVVDEAYAEFARAGQRSALELLPGRPRLVVTRTMSKAFGFAGGRLGYLAADAAVVEAVQLVRLPYHLSTLTQAAGRAALAHRAALLGTVEAVKEQRDRIVATLRRRGHPVADSDANFVLFGVAGDQARVWERLVARGVLVRDVGLAGWLRVTAGTPAETDAFLGALEEIA